MKTKLLSVLCAVCVVFFLLTAAIGLPIYIRPFYYAHIEAFDLARVSGYSEEEIREAYDEVLDYLTLPGKKMLWKITKARSKSRAARAPMAIGAATDSTAAQKGALCLPIR